MTRGIALRAIQVPKSYRPLLARRTACVYPAPVFLGSVFSPSALRPSRSLGSEPPFSFLSSLHRPARFQQAELPVYQASRRFPLRPRARVQASSGPQYVLKPRDFPMSKVYCRRPFPGNTGSLGVLLRRAENALRSFRDAQRCLL